MSQGPFEPPGEPSPPAPPANPPAPPISFAWTPELASGQVPGQEPPPEPVHRGRLIAIWVLCTLAVLLLALVAAGMGGTRRTGPQIVGSVLGVYLIAALLVGVAALFARRGRRRRLFLSPVLPALGIVVAVLSLIGTAGASSGTPSTAAHSAGATPATSGSPSIAASPSASGAPMASADPARALVIRAPYTLQRPSVGEEQAVLAQMNLDNGAFKSFTVRRVMKSNSFVAYAFLAETDLQPGAEALAMGLIEMAFANEAASNADVKKEHSTVNGHDVVTLSSKDGVVAMWAEAPFLKMVVAFDRATVDSIVQSFVNS